MTNSQAKELAAALAAVKAANAAVDRAMAAIQAATADVVAATKAVAAASAVAQTETNAAPPIHHSRGSHCPRPTSRFFPIKRENSRFSPPFSHSRIKFKDDGRSDSTI